MGLWNSCLATCFGFDPRVKEPSGRVGQDRCRHKLWALVIFSLFALPSGIKQRESRPLRPLSDVIVTDRDPLPSLLRCSLIIISRCPMCVSFTRDFLLSSWSFIWPTCFFVFLFFFMSSLRFVSIRSIRIISLRSKWDKTNEVMRKSHIIILMAQIADLFFLSFLGYN